MDVRIRRYSKMRHMIDNPMFSHSCTGAMSVIVSVTDYHDNASEFVGLLA
jgi:hypothetical protein